jgi:phenylacetate-CoA ligase
MKINTEKIYHSLPVFIQNLAISFFGFYWYGRRFGGVFKEELKACKQRERFSKLDWENYQETELRKLLIHSNKNVPYYRELFRKEGINEADLANFSLKNIQSIPVLEKKTFRMFCDSKMLSEQLEPKGSFLFTSGSSGTPLKIRYSKRMHQKYFGIYESNVRNWAGIDVTMSRGVIGGRRILKDGDGKGPYYRYNFVEKQVYFSAYHISKDTVSNYLEGIVKYKISYLEGYSSAIYFLARFIEESGLKAPALKAVLGSTDKLTSEMRNTIRRVFHCETFDSYNGVDICNLISECEHHRLHIVPDAGIVEVLNENGENCKQGEVGELVSTGLLNFDQPLIRYKIGDLVKLSKETTCPCGRNMVIIDEIVGRIEDVVIGPDGREMRRFNRILIEIGSVIEGQIIQHELTKFEIKLVVFQSPSQLELETIRSRMFAQLGKVDIEIQIVDSIPRGPNGKFKAVISHVKKL